MDVLRKLKKSNIRATDIAAQFWCEKQMELGYLFGHKITTEIKKGKDIHEILENETNIPVLLMPKSYADVLYKIFYTSTLAIKTLKENGRAREIQIYGSINGFPVVGKIDQLEYKNELVTIWEDKTKTNDNLPNEPQLHTHKIQVMLYKKLLDNILTKNYTKEKFDASYNTSKLRLSEEFIRQLDALKIKKEEQNLDFIISKYFKSILDIGKVDDFLRIRYINQFTGKEIKTYKFLYDKQDMEDSLKFVLSYWKGEREALAVPENEKWKCQYCGFYGKECKVWWPQKQL
jgi:exonuclease V